MSDLFNEGNRISQARKEVLPILQGWRHVKTARLGDSPRIAQLAGGGAKVQRALAL